MIAVNGSITTAPITGKMQAWTVKEGDVVAAGDAIAVMEAMKMEVQVYAQCAGRLTQRVAANELVAAGAAVAEIRP